tara:strand:- start:15914 stop:16828 length:915 start_codon:yes stop_codon:yes gene_type:complete
LTIDKYYKKELLIKKNLNSLKISINLKDIKKYYIPLLNIINFYNSKKVLNVGISGAQGSGKTRLSKILKVLVENILKKKVLILSIDDFYHTKSDRQCLANNIHPLLKTRGVPGTHDIELLNQTINDVQNKAYKNLEIPVFSKFFDERMQKRIKISFIPDIVLLEGWCVKASPVPKKILINPINELEKNFDKDYVWRNYYNNQLKNNYKELFSKIDLNIFLKVPNFRRVFDWRKLQEIESPNSDYKKNEKVNDKKLKYFIMHYEKITKWMLKDMQKKSDICIMIDNKHRFSNIKFNRRFKKIYED